MAEQGLDDQVIGICFDGTGFGTDGNIWGSEFMIAGLENCRRISHFDYVAMPGGDRVVAEPWRMAFSYIYKYYRNNFDYYSLPVFRNAGKKKLDLVQEMIENNVNSPLSSGAGRLFDAVSALTGLCSVAAFDSEAPMRLEAAINEETDDIYPFNLSENVDFNETFRAIVNDMTRQNISFISAKFHNTVAKVIADVAIHIREENSINKVVLSGGVFQNRYLLEKTLSFLSRSRFRVFVNRQVPANDGGLSLGQLIIASKNRK
jgi:hydrogenase maturation protein HypF